MSETFFEANIATHRGAGYRDDQIVSHSYYETPIDNTQGDLHGNSRVWGDADLRTQQGAVDALIDAGRRAGLSDHDIAYVISIARVESGFNPDAAAGTTSASGLGQFVNKTASAYGISDANRWDATKQAEALVAHYIDNKSIAGKKDLGEEYIYAFHHDGPSLKYGGLDISKSKVMPFVSVAEELLRVGDVENEILETYLQPAMTPAGVKYVTVGAMVSTPAGMKNVHVGSHLGSVYFDELDSLMQSAFESVLSETDPSANGPAGSGARVTGYHPNDPRGPWQTPGAPGDQTGSQNRPDNKLVQGQTRTVTTTRVVETRTGTRTVTETTRLDYQNRTEDDPEFVGAHPVLLDLDGNGLQIGDLSRSTRFIAGEDGLQHRTAWAGAGDGVLFYDVGNDGKISDSREYVFTEWASGATDDMAALRAVFDGNGDGKLTSADAKFSDFKVLVTNADGTTTALALAQLRISEATGWKARVDEEGVDISEGFLLNLAENTCVRVAQTNGQWRNREP